MVTISSNVNSVSSFMPISSVTGSEGKERAPQRSEIDLSSNVVLDFDRGNGWFIRSGNTIQVAPVGYGSPYSDIETPLQIVFNPPLSTQQARYLTISLRGFFSNTDHTQYPIITVEFADRSSQPIIICNGRDGCPAGGQVIRSDRPTEVRIPIPAPLGEHQVIRRITIDLPAGTHVDPGAVIGPFALQGRR